VRVEFTVISYINYTLRLKIFPSVWKLHSAYLNHTLRVEITHVRGKITVVSVVIAFVRVKITLSV
jgi:hypothetical protein